MKNTIQKFSKIKTLVIGDIMLDNYLKGSVNRISPEAPVPVVKINNQTYTLGGAANVANNLKSLGAKVWVCGITGQDYYSKILQKILEQQKIQNLTFQNKEIPTIVKTRIMAQHQQLLRYDYEETKEISKELENELIQKLKPIIEKVDVVILSDYNKGLLSKTLSQKIIKHCRKNKKIVLADPKPQNINNFKNCTLICPNHKEAVQITNTNHEEILPEVAKKLLKKTNSDYVVITCGEGGMLTYDKKENFHEIPAKAREVFDVTGAGDTSLAVLALSMAVEQNLARAAYLANKAGGIVVGKTGTATINQEELIKSLEND